MIAFLGKLTPEPR